MALRIIGSRTIFSREFNTEDLTEDQADKLISIAEDMLYEYNPTLVWLTYTSEIGYEDDDERIEDIEDEKFSIYCLEEDERNLAKSI